MKSLFHNFDMLVDSPGGVKKLREMILHLAVTGKLVPQDPEDEPAGVLLEKIKEEKERLIKEGRIKKNETIPDIAGEKKLFGLPKNWKWVHLDEICEYIQRGRGPKYIEISDIPVVSQKCIQWSGFEIKKARFVDPKSLIKYGNERFLRTGDLLWNSTGTGTLGRICVYNHDDNKYDKVVADSHVTVVRPLFINPKFIFIFLSSPIVQNVLEERASGTTKQIELSTSTVRKQVVPIPPLNEQKRIVAKVDQLMALCDELEKKKEKRSQKLISLNTASLGKLLESGEPQEFQEHWQRITDNFDILYNNPENVVKLKQTILQLAVMGKLVPQDPKDEPASVLLEKIKEEKERLIKEGKIKKQKPLPEIKEEDKPYNLPEGWEWVYLGNVAEIVRGGSPRPAGDPIYYDGNIPFLKVADITSNSDMYLHTYTFTIKKAGLKKTRFIKANTLLLTNSGATLGIPKICSFDTALNDGIAAFLNVPNNVYIPYLYNFLKSRSRWFLKHASRGQGQPNLNTDIIRLTLFTLPPTDEQKRIVARVDELMGLCERLEQSLKRAEEKSEKIFNAIVHHLQTTGKSFS